MPETRPDHIPSSDEFTAARTGNFFVRDGVLLPTEDFINNIDGCRVRLKGTYTVQDGVRVIGRGAFRNCVNLQAILLPEGVTEIAPLAFAGCTSLVRLAEATHDTGQAKVALPHTIRNIGYKAFSGCLQLIAISFDSEISYIAPQTFEDCGRLQKVERCSSIGSIGRAAFRGCDDLQELVGLKSTCAVEPYAFAGCTRFHAPEGLDVSTTSTVPAREILKPKSEFEVYLESLDISKCNDSLKYAVMAYRGEALPEGIKVHLQPTLMHPELPFSIAYYSEAGTAIHECDANGNAIWITDCFAGLKGEVPSKAPVAPANVTSSGTGGVYSPQSRYGSTGVAPQSTQSTGSIPQYGPANSGTSDNSLGDAQFVSLAGMVCSIVSFFTLPIILGIVGLVLSTQGQKKTPAGVQNSYAKAGKILGIINIIFYALVICVLIIFFVVATKTGTSTNSFTY